VGDEATFSPVEDAALLYGLAGRDGETVGVGARFATLHSHSLGAVALPTGELATCDPLAGVYDASAFARRVAPGSYPVEVCVVEFMDDGDQRVAFAVVRLSSEDPVAWELALWPGQDLAALDAGHYFGYPVDAGTGCFASREALAQLSEILASHFERTPAEDDPLSAAMAPTYVHTWSWANLALDASTNVVAFSTGYGDGVYPTCWGLDAAGAPVCALTDFLLIDPAAATARR
jgi:hypothetical protein